jgi:hypothetical protein
VREIWDIAWHRFNVIQAIVSDANARIIAILFYFTVLLPFGLAYTAMADPLRLKLVKGSDGKMKSVGQVWLEREPVPNDLDSARQQG